MNKTKLLTILLLLSALGGCHKRGGLDIGDTVPKVSLPDFQGKTMTLPQDLQGKLILLHFWALDCVYCDKQVLLDLEPLYQKYKARGFVPVAVNVSPVDADDEDLKPFKRLTYPMLVDERGLVAKKFGVVGLPASFVIDQEGVLRKKVSGEAGLNEFEQFFTTLLK